jgi:hypothetical protein
MTGQQKEIVRHLSEDGLDRLLTQTDSEKVSKFGTNTLKPGKHSMTPSGNRDTLSQRLEGEHRRVDELHGGSIDTSDRHENVASDACAADRDYEFTW